MIFSSKQDEAMCIAQEEAAEVIQAISKIRRSGFEFRPHDGEHTNAELAQYEIYDFLILIELAQFKTEVPEVYRQYKMDKLAVYSSLFK